MKLRRVAAVAVFVASCSGKRKSPEPPTGGRMVEIPSGSFLMGCTTTDGSCRGLAGSATPARKVFVSTFWIDVTEVTVADYARCEQAGVCGHAFRHPGCEDAHLPITGVTWFDADRYCRWIGRRLPTEAEWEKAARGTDGRTFPWGNEAPSCERAQYFNPDDSTRRTSCERGWVVPVGSLPAGASPYGVLDLAGNAREWTGDWYHPDFYRFGPTKDPTGDDFDRTGLGRTVRGGTSRLELTTFFRTGLPPDVHGSMGFRCVRDQTP